MKHIQRPISFSAISELISYPNDGKRKINRHPRLHPEHLYLTTPSCDPSSQTTHCLFASSNPVWSGGPDEGFQCTAGHH